MSTLKQFEYQQYLNIETFRKNGQGVKTPVWFAQEEGGLYIWTETTSGKARRVRATPRVMIAPSRADGSLLGEWLPALASADDSPAALDHIRKLMRAKYGVMFAMFGLLGLFRRARYTSIRVEPEQ